MTTTGVLRLGLFLVLGACAAAPVAEPAPLPSGLPVIGGTSVTRPACVVLRDVVMPALQAAIDTDRNHKDLAQHYRDYLYAQSSRVVTGDATKRMAVVRLEHDETVMQNELNVISRALGDPRVSAEQTDPQIRALRGALQDLNASVQAQLANVGDVTGNANFQLLFNDDESLTKMRGSMGIAQSSHAGSLPTPMPYTAVGPTPQPGLGAPGPVTGDSIDAAIAAAPSPASGQRPLMLPGTVGAAESAAARTIIAASNACR